ncbi:MAG: hypothetical protein ACUVQ1_04885 [Candidatus Kapaibacteriales bacterium]
MISLCKQILIAFVSLLLFQNSYSLKPKDLALNPLVNISFDSNRTILQLNFLDFPFDGTLIIKRKNPKSNFWEKEYRLNPSTHTFTDTIDSGNEPMEYGVELSTDTLIATGYFIAGNSEKIHWDNGLALILVDETLADSISNELVALRTGMTCDGWTTEVEFVPRSETFNPLYISKLKRLIKRYSQISGDRLRAILFVGRLPVPYTGNYTFDGHSDHIGAFPSDLCYVCYQCNWTDDQEYNVSAKRIENWNVPFDGKFDLVTLDTLVQIAIGRIDFFALPAFRQTETELVKRYIRKNLAFRSGGLNQPFRALIDDGFGMSSKESFATSAWLNFKVLVDTIVEGKFLENVTQNDFLFAYGCNSGSYTSVWSVVESRDASIRNLRVAFAFLFGSYLWDWDVKDNLLRSVLASDSMVVGVGWMGRPYWHLHHLWLDEPIANSLIQTYNNQSLYRSLGIFGYRGAHLQFFGDPTLKLFYPKPIENLSFLLDKNYNYLKLRWALPLDTNGFVGFIVLKSRQKYSDYQLITPLPLKNFNFIDDKVYKGKSFYIVRPVYRYSTRFGNVFRLGIGKMVEVSNE